MYIIYFIRKNKDVGFFHFEDQLKARTFFQSLVKLSSNDGFDFIDFTSPRLVEFEK